MSIVSKIRRELKRERIWKEKDERHRLIAPALFNKLRAKKICDNCDKKIKGKSEIHHKIPVSKGGNSEESNLMVVCKQCHKILDKEALK